MAFVWKSGRRWLFVVIDAWYSLKCGSSKLLLWLQGLIDFIDDVIVLLWSHPLRKTRLLWWYYIWKVYWRRSRVWSLVCVITYSMLEMCRASATLRTLQSRLDPLVYRQGCCLFAFLFLFSVCFLLLFVCFSLFFGFVLSLAVWDCPPQ